ncbi:hypothetical protein ACRRTK_010893 [Alexandromys fortis]
MNRNKAALKASTHGNCILRRSGGLQRIWTLSGSTVRETDSLNTLISRLSGKPSLLHLADSGKDELELIPFFFFLTYFVFVF